MAVCLLSVYPCHPSKAVRIGYRSRARSEIDVNLSMSLSLCV